MPKAIVKFYRDPQEATNAVSQLRAKGYKAEEIGVLTGDKDKMAKLASKASLSSHSFAIPGLGSVVAAGPVATALTEAGASAPSEALLAALTSLWGIPEETTRYYQFGVSVGGVAVSVHVEEARAHEAQEILRGTAAKAERAPIWSSSPGFAAASRMTETDPIDAKMTGDFRRY